MGTLELKTNLHSLIDKIENPQLLESLYQILSRRSTGNKLWMELSTAQRNEVLEAYDESNDPKSLIPHSEILRDLK